MHIKLGCLSSTGNWFQSDERPHPVFEVTKLLKRISRPWVRFHQPCDLASKRYTNRLASQAASSGES